MIMTSSLKTCPACHATWATGATQCEACYQYPPPPTGPIVDYVLRPVKVAHYPGSLKYRTESTPLGKGYPTHEAAWKRANRVNAHYLGKWGQSISLTVVPRRRQEA